LILTEWNEFRRPNFERVKESLKYPVLFDGRNQYEAEQMAKKGFHYFPVGRLPIPVSAPITV
jgi:UDPglucose 6-dehydrogenase